MRPPRRATLGCGDARLVQPPSAVVADPARAPATPRRVAARSATRGPSLSSGSMEGFRSHDGPGRATLCRTVGGLRKVNYCWAGRTNMEPTFSHAEVFPLIAQVIVRAPADDSGFVDHESIVSAVLSDADGSSIIRRASTASSLPDHRHVASNMVAWFSQQITVERSPWAEFFDRERRGGAWAYRPKTAVLPPIAADAELSAVEGDPRMFFHLRRERDPAIAQAKREAAQAADGRLQCEACGFATQVTFPGLGGEVCEIHHRLPLASASEAVDTHLEDLAVLCANCHRAIHRTNPLMSVEDFRDHYCMTTGPEGAGEQGDAADGLRPPLIANTLDARPI